MKIIHLVLGKANPNRMNGVNKVVHNLATYQQQLGQNVGVWGITHSDIHRVHEAPYPHRLFKAHRNKLVLDDRLKAAIESLSFDANQTVFHIHGAFIPEFFHVARLLVKFQIPYVYMPHGAFNPVAMQKNHWVKWGYFQLFERYVVKHAKGVHFLGKIQHDSMDRLLVLNNKFMLPNGQNLSEVAFHHEPMERPNVPVFGFCGRMDIYYKGLDLLFEAFRTYKVEGGKGVLWLIGDGADRTALEQQAAALDIEDSVVFYGKRFGQEKLNLLAHMDIFLHPSRSEGTPTAVLEAAALKKPCIVSTYTNVGEVVADFDAGIHLPENTPTAIAQALHEGETWFQQNQLHQYGKNAYEMVTSTFNWENVAQQLVEKYQA